MKYQNLLFLMAVPLLSNSQNLVPNHSFESYNKSCNSYSIAMAIPWFSPNTYFGGSTDYYNPCLTFFQCSTPLNRIGYQEAKTGVAYGGFAPFVNYNSTLGRSRGREYLEVKLTDSLFAKKKYLVSFYVSLGDRSNIVRFAIETLGAYFSKDSVLTQSYDALSQYEPQILNRSGIIKDSINWILVTDTFTAQGGERFMTIGNFNPDSTSNIDTLYKPISNSTAAYYYIDDVSVIPDTTTGLTPTLSKRERALSVDYNAEWQKAFINARNLQGKKCDLRIYDMLGNILFKEAGKLSFPFGKGQGGAYTKDIDMAAFAKGMYVAHLQTEKEQLVKKFVKD